MNTRNLLVVLVLLGVLGGAGWLAVTILDAPPEPADGTPHAEESDPEGERVRAKPGAMPLVDDGDADPEPAIVERPGVEMLPVPEGGKPWFQFVGYEEVLDEVDWIEMGTLHAELSRLLNQLANERARGGEPRAEVTVRLQQLYERMFEVTAPRIDRLPTMNDTTVAAHPAFAANLVAAVLHTRGDGLDLEQGRTIETLAREHCREGDGRIDGNADQPFLTRAIDEAEQRSRFFAAVEKSLTTSQSRALHSEIARDRVGLDRFSAAVVWDGITEATHCHDEDSAVEMGTMRILEGMPTPPEMFRQAMGIVRARVKTLPEEVVYERRGWLNQMGHLREPDVRDGAGWTLATLRAIIVEFAQGRYEPQIPPDVMMRPVVFAREPIE